MCHSAVVITGVYFPINFYTLAKTTCNAEEKARCRADQVCEVEGHVAVCKCASDRLERNGRCSGNCTLECHHRFGSCTIFNNEEHCNCTSPLQGDSSEQSTKEGPCVLESFSYLTSLKLNRSISSWKVAEDCRNMKDLLTQALSVLFGPEFLHLDIVSCLDAYEVRLIFSKKQDEAVLKRLHLCKNSIKPHSCYFWPDVHVVSGSVG
ncbi:uncharacterized protein LOC135373168, partial [Ornithodoros turicata]|uniref:uncharacterized protein LOC135373168 n=1 Tax=Ornithodoros turicata TaxID=34597 RepID=UPI003139017F